jgi:hypothetical protein
MSFVQVVNVDAHGGDNVDQGPPSPGERDVPHVFTINDRDRLELSQPVTPGSSVTVMGLIHRIMEVQTKNKATEATANMMCDLISDVFTNPGQGINYRHHKSHGRCVPGVEVDGWKRTSVQGEEKNKRQGRRSRSSGVMIENEHLPRLTRVMSGRRFGRILYIVYTRMADSGRWVLLCRVELFKTLMPVAGSTEITVHPGQVVQYPVFVRVENLGPVVAFGPTALEGDGDVEGPTREQFWNRPQTVLWCCRDDAAKWGCND